MKPFSLVEPYDAMATRLFPYDQVAGYFHQHIQQYRPQAHTLLDMACGSGNLTIPLGQLGYQVTGLDYSVDMLEAARKKAQDLPITFQQHDIASPWPGDPVDVVTSFYGGLNFLIRLEAAQKYVQAVYEALLPGGLFLFEQFSAAKMRSEFHGLKAADFETFYVITHSICNAEGYITHQVTYFLRQEDGRYRREEELQLMRIHPFDDLSQWLTTAGFHLLGLMPIYPELNVPTLQDSFLFIAQKPQV
jgi:SAM-dependent methyltransferase